MSDPIADGQRLARALGNPDVQYRRPLGSSTAPVPIYYVRWQCRVHDMYVIAGSTVPADGTAHLKIYYVRGGVTHMLYNDVFYGFTAGRYETLDNPSEDLIPGDVIYVQITPANAVALPEMIIGLQLELT